MRKGSHLRSWLAWGLVGLLAVGFPGPVSAAGNPPPAAPETEGTLAVATEPAGAAVYVDGTMQGATPVSLSVAAGEHRVKVVKDGYLDNGRLVSVKAGQANSVQVKLTPTPKGTTRLMQVEEPPKGGGGGSGKILLIALGAVAVGAGVYLLVRNKNEPPVAALAIDAGGTALAGATAVRFDGGGSTDPDNDPLTYTWDFGDGSTGSGATTTHTYNSAASFNVTLTVSDGKKSATAQGSLAVRSMTGTWSGNIGGPDFITLTLTQSGSSLSGVYSDTVNGTGPASGAVSSPRQVTVRSQIPGFVVCSWVGAADTAVNRFTGSVDCFAGTRAFTFTRR